MFGKLSLIFWLVVFIAVAIMFDWFGSREMASSLLTGTQTAVEKLEKTGDQVQGVVEVVSEKTEQIKEAKKQAEESLK